MALLKVQSVKIGHFNSLSKQIGDSISLEQILIAAAS